ncbi:MAG TPA: Acyl-CoA dehydrogenase C-terminal domain-containing protein, partial [Draconibacterium sp.]|nr:Acyl-CoA dehydrogenase C-terminal domain-containing protein [Draconibacterium sp.]
REYESQKITPELEFMRRTLIILTDDYEHAVARVVDSNDNEFIDFHARRLVEMAGFIIMSYLLVIDSNRDASYIKSAKVFIRLTKSLVKGHAEFIRGSVVEDLGAYKIEME